MSAGQTNRFTGEPRYMFYRSNALRCYIVSDTEGDYRGAPYKLVDAYRSRKVAEYAVRALNAGMARVDSHAIVGCKVVAS